MSSVQSVSNESQAYRTFLGSCRSTVTKNVYATKFENYRRWSKMTDAQLLKVKPKDQQQKIIDFLEENKAPGLAYKSLAIYVSAIKRFFKSNSYGTLEWEEITRHLPEHVRRVKDRAYTVEEIRAMLAKADERKKLPGNQSKRYCFY